LKSDGKFGLAALAIAIVSSVTLLVMVTLGVLLIKTGGGTRAINYFIGMTTLICWLFELIAIVVGIIGLFGGTRTKRFALAAIAISAVCFVGTLVPILMGRNGGFR
jgi:hypothetical protein